jgi:hypothetical protein
MTWREVAITTVLKVIVLVGLMSPALFAQESATTSSPAPWSSTRADDTPAAFVALQQDVAGMKEQQAQQTKLMLQLQAAIAQLQQAVAKPTTEQQAEALLKSLESGEAEIAPTCKAAKPKRKPFVAFVPIDGKVTRIVGCVP